MLNGHGKVLVVDDDPFIRSLLAAWLQEAGYGVVMAADGQQALERVREDRPDIILLDLTMPRLDGYAVVRWLRQRPETRGLPILVVSADVRAHQKLAGLRVEGILSKPFDLDEVLDRVQEYVPRHTTKAAV
ncbi:MAG: response regulator [Chloroflexi bacterium]|nr:response regulator [Chloroflexota bacterium]